MPNYDLTQLTSLITTNGNNPVSTSRSDMPIVNNMSKEINWQLLAGFLDQEIFQFILKNKDNEVINPSLTGILDSSSNTILEKEPPGADMLISPIGKVTIAFLQPPPHQLFNDFVSSLYNFL